MVVSVKPRRPWVAVSLLLLGFTPALAFARDLPPIRESQPLGMGNVASSTRNLSLEDRIQRLEGLLEGQTLVDMLVRLEELQQEVQALRGENEVLTHTLDGITKRQRDLYLDIDRRLRQMQASSAGDTGTASSFTSDAATSQDGMTITAGSSAILTAAPTGVGQGAGVDQASSLAATAAPATGANTNVDPQLEQAAYTAAFNVLKDGQYKQSIAAFNSFMQQYPQGQYAGNAQYWIGEAYYVLRDYTRAITEFTAVLNSYPDSPKRADAMLKVGFAYYELQEWLKSQQALSDLVAQYPQSTAAQLAKNRLHRMKLEGKVAP